MIEEVLAFHLVSEHCDGMAIARTFDENVEAHDHEHVGPGTIRNHLRSNLDFDADEIESVLDELEAENQ